MALVWSEKFATGVESIDRQHQRLFSKVNELEDLIRSKNIDGLEIDNLMSFLTEYVALHFHHEEFCMELNQCPVATKNKKAHEDFLQFLSSFKHELKITNPADREALLRKLQHTLETWLDGHICTIDVQLRQTKVNQAAFSVSEK